MPQPYRQKKGHVYFHPDSLLQRPILGKLIGCVAAEAARTDLHFVRLVSKLLEYSALNDAVCVNDLKKGTRFGQLVSNSYLSISGSTARVAMLKALAESILAQHDISDFREIMKHANSCAKKRNRIIHGIWGYDTNLPERLVLQDITDVIAHEGAGPDTTVKAYIYDSEDFNNIIRDIQDLNAKLAFYKPSSLFDSKR